MKQVVVAVIAVVVASGVQAGTKPLYQPAPAWVVPAPPLDATADDGVPRRIFDQQQRLSGGQVWSYVDVATRITSQQSLLETGTVILSWQPDEGDLIVHRIAIIRDGKTIDLLAEPEPLSVLRRERGLESLEIDGVLTATMPVKGLQVGDTLRVTHSVTHSDPALKGNLQSSVVLLPDQTQVGFARIRALWPAATDVRWKALAKVTDAKLTKTGDFRELSVTTPLPKQPDLPPDAPARYHALPLVELSTFRDWADVSRTMAPLFAPVPFAAGSPLAAEAARIRAAASDPLARTALALESVQGNVRYLFNGLDHGNYNPQLPEKTWAIRSGDCKAKTLLLLSLLAALDIQAEPVLANTRLGGFLPARLPSAGAFNHILVMATVAGKTYWLDGTGLGIRPADLGDTPNLRFVLPLRVGGATLIPVSTHANARPTIALTLDLDQSAGIGLPAPVTVDVTFTGPSVEALKAADKKLSGDKRKAMIDGFVNNSGMHTLVVSRTIDYDPAAGTATIHITGLTNEVWPRDDQRYQNKMDVIVDKLQFGGDRGRPEWRNMPVATPGPVSTLFRARLRLPDGGRGFTLEGDRTLPPTLAGQQVHQSVVFENGVVDMTGRLDATAAEVPADQVAATKAALALAKSRSVKVLAPRDYPAHWKVVRAARAAGKIAPIEAAFATAIADATEKPPLIADRAAFLASVYDRAGAIADLTTVIATRPTVPVLLTRAGLYHQTGKDAAALTDAKAAYDLDPGDIDPLRNYALMLAYAGRTPAAVALLDEAISAGGERRGALLSTKAAILGRDRQADAALAAVDAAVAAKPGDAGLLNERCWLKGTLGVHLDTALKDCTKALELGVDSGMALDSRAMVFLKLNRLDDARTDVDAALVERPDSAGSLFLRGVIAARQGAKPASTDDLTGARTMAPRIDEDYRPYDVTAG